MDMEPAAKKPRTGGLDTLSEELIEPMIHYAMTHGLVYANVEREKDPSLSTQCPVAMLPFKLPRKAFDDVVALSLLWNELVDAVSRDLDWMYSTLEAAARADPFTQRLVEMCKEIQSEGLRQPLYLGIHRSDYMLHEPEGGAQSPCFLQVELNTIASSMGAHAGNATDMHQYLLGRYGTNTDLQTHYGVDSPKKLLAALPKNETLQKIPAAIAAAHHAYLSACPERTVVLFVVQGTERNFADQRWFEFRLWQDHGVTAVRKTLKQIHHEGILDVRGKLFLGDLEVSVVYFRAGYTPDDYPSEEEWQARTMIEKSMAIKSPSVAYQLVGAKKVQQQLARPGAVERFVGEEKGKKLRTCFAGLWGLGPGEDDAGIMKKAMDEPHLYVLKPQREGGGHNFYGAAMASKLQELSQEDRGAFILMQRILPRVQPSVLTRAGKTSVLQGLSEFGFYSVFLGDSNKVQVSEHAGHLVRTKGEGVDEGGVAAGYAVISSPFLI